MYYFCLFIFLILSGLGVIMFFPDYDNSLFPLFLDFQTILLFIPSYSILFYGIFFHLIKKNLKKLICFSFNNELVNKCILCLYVIIVFIISLHIQDFYSLKTRCFLAMFGAFLGFLVNVILNVLSHK